MPQALYWEKEAPTVTARNDTTRSTHRRRPETSPIRRELAAIGRHPRKRLGQHFLADPQVARRIVDLAGLCTTDRVIEIGPGLGALSDLLVERAGEIWLVEVDSDLAQRLGSKYAHLPHVHVVEADALAVDFTALLGPGAPAVVVANLPYNIAAAVLAALLAQPECFSRMVLMLQREVVERLVAQPGGKIYGALSVLTQFSAQVRSAMRVEPEAFVPRPKVESDVVIVEPYRRPPVPVVDTALFRRLVKTAFNHRRKQIANSLKGLCSDPTELLCGVNIDPMRRPETLSLVEFAAVADALTRARTDRTARAGGLPSENS
ncbi:MAG: 16S rRNA (adenine(1518)-N(6)/adenine(1519)-N(6))-dimethyltransferase RsmA [Candidatus Binatia bacterium]